MYVKHDFGLVRIVHDGSPLKVQYDIRVEWRDSLDDEWTLYSGFNSFSNDYAFTESQAAATRAIKTKAEQMAAKYGCNANIVLT